MFRAAHDPTSASFFASVTSEPRETTHTHDVAGLRDGCSFVADGGYDRDNCCREPCPRDVKPIIAGDRLSYQREVQQLPNQGPERSEMPAWRNPVCARGMRDRVEHGEHSGPRSRTRAEPSSACSRAEHAVAGLRASVAVHPPRRSARFGRRPSRTLKLPVTSCTGSCASAARREAYPDALCDGRMPVTQSLPGMEASLTAPVTVWEGAAGLGSAGARAFAGGQVSVAGR